MARKPHIYSKEVTIHLYHENDGSDYRCAGCGNSISYETVDKYFCSVCNNELDRKDYKFCPRCGMQFTGRFENCTLNKIRAELRRERNLCKKEQKAAERAEYDIRRNNYETLYMEI